MSVVVNPIYTAADYEAALRDVEQLMEAEPGTAEFDRLNVLAVLVDAYETANHPVPPPDPISTLEHYMDRQGLSRKQLEEVLGCGSGRVSEILNRKRSLSIGMIRKLHERFGISLEILIQDYALDDDADQNFAVANASSSERR